MEALITVIFIVIIFLSWLFIFFGGLGTLLILLFSILYSLFTRFEIITPKVLLALALIYLTGEIFDYVFIALGAKFSGAGKRAGLAAIIGGLIGVSVSLAIFPAEIFPLTLLGIFLGAFLAELKEKKDILRALRAGLGSSLGRLSAVLFKALLGILMLTIVIIHILSYLK